MSSWIKFPFWLQRMLANSWTVFTASPCSHMVRMLAFQSLHTPVLLLRIFWAAWCSRRFRLQCSPFPSSLEDCSLLSRQLQHVFLQKLEDFSTVWKPWCKMISRICWPSSNLRCHVLSIPPWHFITNYSSQRRGFQSPYLTCEKYFFLMFQSEI